MKQWVLIVLLVFAYQLHFGQINKNGIPFIQSYSNLVYDAAEQNWCIVQDNRGVMYFGNNDNGILEFDGKNWRKINLPNNPPVPCMAIDKNGTIFIGSATEFGYLAPVSNGELKYNSLSQKLDTSERKFGLIKKIIIRDKDVLFCAQTKIFQYDYKTVKLFITPHKYSFYTFNVNSFLLTGNYGEGLLNVSTDTQIVIPNGEFFAYKNIYSILPQKNNWIITTGANGIFNYDYSTGKLSQNILTQNPEKWIENKFLYDAINLEYPDIAVASVIDCGGFIFDTRGKIKEYYGKENGFPDNQGIAVYTKLEQEKVVNPLWYTLNGGYLSKVEINSPFRRFGEESGLAGLVSQIIRYKGVLYVATSGGVYAQVFDNDKIARFKKIEGIDNYATSFQIMKLPEGREILLAGTILGIFIVDGVQASSFEEKITNLVPSKLLINVFDMKVSSFNRNRLYIVGSEFHCIEYVNGKWSMQNKLSIEKFNDNLRSVAEESENIVWVGSERTGFYRINLTEKDSNFVQYTSKNGLPVTNGYSLYRYNNQIHYASLNKGLFKFDEKNQQFTPDSSLGVEFSKPFRSIFRLANGFKNDYWISFYATTQKGIEQKGVEHVTVQKDGSLVHDTLPFKRLPNSSVETIYCDDSNITWFGISKVIYSFDASYKKDYYRLYPCLIRQVMVGDDTLFNGAFTQQGPDSIPLVSMIQPKNKKYSLDYRNNDITFYYAAPFFENEVSTEYSWFLTGSSETWSKWNKESYFPFTNLNEGDYIFKVKARNIYGVESQVAEFCFTVKPPWYRTIIAYILYVILAIVTVVVIVKLYTRKLELEKIRLEQIVKERTAEVVAQKEQIEIQRDEIAGQKKSVEDSIHYASRIQNAILPGKDFIDLFLKEYFILWRPRDIVSGDFFWMTIKGDKIIIAAADCTGHGVPGAFMSMLGVSFLNEIVLQNDIVDAHLILNHLRAHVKKTLSQTGKDGEAKDGMDIALCVLDMGNLKMQFAGAYNPCYILRNKELIEIKGDRMPIGIYIKEKESFTLNEFDLQLNDTFYIASDGYVSQFGQDDGEKFKSSRLRELLIEICEKPMEEQKQIMDQRLEEWRCEYEQVDDILVIGARIL